MNTTKNNLVRLNSYIAKCGICSRRNADELIKSGKVKINGQPVLEIGYRVQEGDDITIKGKRIVLQEKFYVLLNKPAGYVTTLSDEKKRRTVMELIKKVTPVRLFPVGRLDLNTTGLLLLTNDGEFAQKLAHPKYEVKKVYQVVLSRPLLKEDFEKIVKGVKLSDGVVIPDKIKYISENLKKLEIEIHSGKNRIIKRIFEHLGYMVKSLDRIYYAGLLKGRLKLGESRQLSEKEVERLLNSLK